MRPAGTTSLALALAFAGNRSVCGVWPLTLQQGRPRVAIYLSEQPSTSQIWAVRLYVGLCMVLLASVFFWPYMGLGLVL